MIKHTFKDRTPYTYCLTFKPTGQRYYGARWAKGCHPTDLFKSYFTSSERISKMILENGKESFQYQIRKVFNSAEACRVWEQKVITRLRVSSNANWINGRYIPSGDMSGPNNPMYKAKRSDLSARNSSTKGYIWINNGSRSMQIPKIQFKIFEELGYTRGMHCKRSIETRALLSKSRKGSKSSSKDTIVVYLKDKKKHIMPEQLDYYVSIGWSTDFFLSEIKIKRKEVKQIKNGEIVATYSSIKDAVRSTQHLNTLYSSIYTTIRNGKEHRGYNWSH